MAGEWRFPNDPEGFRRFCEECYPVVSAFCLKMLNDPMKAEDATQDAFAKAWQHQANFRGECPPCAWVRAIARRVCLERMEKAARQNETSLDEAFERDGKELPDSSPPQVYEGPSDDHVTLQRAIEGLDADAQQLILMYYAEGIDLGTIAKCLGMTADACYKMHERVKAKLRRKLSGGTRP